MWKLVPALTIQHIMPCMNSTEPLEICMLPGQMEEEAMTSAEIYAELVCPLRTPNFPPGTHDYDPKRHDLIEGVSKCMISGQEAQAIGLPPEDTQLSTRNTRLWSQETRPHWRSK